MVYKISVTEPNSSTMDCQRIEIRALFIVNVVVELEKGKNGKVIKKNL